MKNVICSSDMDEYLSEYLDTFWTQIHILKYCKLDLFSCPLTEKGWMEGLPTKQTNKQKRESDHNII